MVVILDGKKTSADIIKSMASRPRVKLAVILIGDNAESELYVKMKQKACADAGIAVEIIRKASSSDAELSEIIAHLNSDASVTGMLLQLPLPANLDKAKAIEAISPAKDVDGMTSQNVGKLLNRQDAIESCTAKGVIRLLDAYGIALESKEVCIVGASDAIGKPLGIMCLNRNATVTFTHIKTKDLGEHTKKADILISATGVPRLIKKDMVKNGAVVVDVGISKKDGKVLGDVDFDDVKDKCSHITPVPGGVGPMTIAMLIENLVIMKSKERKMPSVVFMGNNLDVFRLLLKRAHIDAVFTREVSDDKSIIEIKRICGERKIPVYTPSTMRPEKNRTALDTLKGISPDLIVSAGYHLIVPPEIIEIPRRGTVNLHAAPLPEYRGQNVLQWQIINGETETGATLHYMSEGLDEGDIIAQRRCELGSEETALEVLNKVSVMCAELLDGFLDKLERGEEIKSYRQDDSKARYYRKRTPEDGRIDPAKTAKEIHDLVRALVEPWPGAFIDFGGETVVIEKTRLLNTKSLGPGETSMSKEGILLGARDGDILLIERKYIK